MKTGFSTRFRGVKLLLRFVAMTAVHGVSQDFSAWTRHTAFRVNTGLTGADITQEQNDFPLLVRLDSANFPFAEAKGDGRDIRFSGAGGLPLAYEIERWDSAGKKAEVWIRLPRIMPATDTGIFQIHWGNPAAPAASNGKVVFDSAGGFRAAWHLQGGAVRDATGRVADADSGDSSPAAGLVAGGRSVRGNNRGIAVTEAAALHFQAGLTVSLWIYADSWSGGSTRILQKGDSVIEYGFSQEGNNLLWTLNGPTGVTAVMTRLPTAGAWHHIAGTYDGANSRLFVDGEQMATVALTGDLLPLPEDLGLGCRTVQGRPKNNFEGLIDEVTLSARARPREWIKLAYKTQLPQAKVVLPVVPADTGDTTGDTATTCVERFEVPMETTVAEGEMINLDAIADCATGYSWSVVSGPAPRLLDPDVKSLRVSAPRITQDIPVVFRFTANFGLTQRNGTVIVTVKEAIPDPLFTLPRIAAWNGKDLLTLRPTILNNSAVKASKAPNIRHIWTLSNVEVDSTLQPDALILKKAYASGPLEVKLCLDNGGPISCQSLTIPVTLPVGIRAVNAIPGAKGRSGPLWDAAGRRLPALKSVESPGCCGIIEGLLPFGGYRGKEMASRPEGENPPGE